MSLAKLATSDLATIDAAPHVVGTVYSRKDDVVVINDELTVTIDDLKDKDKAGAIVRVPRRVACLLRPRSTYIFLCARPVQTIAIKNLDKATREKCALEILTLASENKDFWLRYKTSHKGVGSKLIAMLEAMMISNEYINDQYDDASLIKANAKVLVGYVTNSEHVTIDAKTVAEEMGKKLAEKEAKLDEKDKVIDEKEK